MKRDDVQRWTFMVPTARGVTRSTYELAEDGLRFITDDPMSASELLPWASIKQGCTAAMPGMGERGVPDLPNWIPSQLEWLLLSRSGVGRMAFMRVLPQGSDRDAIVAAMKLRLDAGWIGERLPIKDAEQKLGISEGSWSTLKVVGIVLAMMAMLLLLNIVFALLPRALIMAPFGFVLGGWLCRRGLAGLRDGLAVANTPTAKAGSAALGLVELQGRAVTTEASAAGVTGRPSIWWDVTVYLWYAAGKNGRWREVAGRHGGRIDLVEFEDDTGRLPIWLQGAILKLDDSSWESGKDTLPAAGIALLDELGFPWNGSRRIRVTEVCLAMNDTLYVLGTLDEWRNLPQPSEAGLIERGLQEISSGRVRRMLVRAAPPALAPTALVVWKGRNGRPFLFANRPEKVALESLRTRSLWIFGFGGAVLAFTLYQLVQLYVGK
jgi:hypothetical protein